MEMSLSSSLRLCSERRIQFGISSTTEHSKLVENMLQEKTYYKRPFFVIIQVPCPLLIFEMGSEEKHESFNDAIPVVRGKRREERYIRP